MDGPIDKDSLYKAIDQNGPYPKTSTGTIEPEHFVKLLRVIINCTYESNQRQNELNYQKRV